MQIRASGLEGPSELRHEFIAFGLGDREWRGRHDPIAVLAAGSSAGVDQQAFFQTACTHDIGRGRPAVDNGSGRLIGDQLEPEEKTLTPYVTD